MKNIILLSDQGRQFTHQFAARSEWHYTYSQCYRTIFNNRLRLPSRGSISLKKGSLVASEYTIGCLYIRYDQETADIFLLQDLNACKIES